MSDFPFAEIEEKLKNVLKPSRYTHTIGVAYTAASLAMKYDCNINKAFLAGLLHDCAKAYESECYISMCQKFNLDVSVYEEKNPQLLHSKLGGYLAGCDYGVSDSEIINSIIYHTTGKPDMTLLEKIIYVADYIEPGRDKAKRLDIIRKMSFENIDKAILMILEDTISYLKKKDMVIDPATENTYMFYKGVC